MMPPPVPTNIYCTPRDVYDLEGVNPIQLREDDNNQASGQVITTSSGAAVGGTSLTVAALQYPLLAGSNLVWSFAGQDGPVESTLSAAAAVGATTLTVSALATAIAAGAQATDNGVNVWLAQLALKACRYATAQILSYCGGRYDDSVLVNSWSVNRWATVIAARWLSKRRYQSAPEGIESDYKDVMEELKAVQLGQLNIESIGTRTSGWPFISNITIDLGSIYRKARVEPTISEPTPTQYPQSIDWNSMMSVEF